jgi:hypothetical protein
MSISRVSSPRPRRPRPADPAAHLGRLGARHGRGEGAVGGVEQVMALVEDDAAQAGGLDVAALAARGARAVEGGVTEHQGVVGDHQIGGS